MEEFLRLEANGWKGRQNTALACNEADRHFFATICKEALQKGQLLAVALRLDGKTLDPKAGDKSEEAARS